MKESQIRQHQFVCSRLAAQMLAAKQRLPALPMPMPLPALMLMPALTLMAMLMLMPRVGASARRSRARKSHSIQARLHGSQCTAKPASQANAHLRFPSPTYNQIKMLISPANDDLSLASEAASPAADNHDDDDGRH